MPSRRVAWLAPLLAAIVGILPVTHAGSTTRPSPSQEKIESVVPLAVVDGRCQAVLETAHADDQYLVVIGSLSAVAGPFQVEINTQPTDGPVRIALERNKPSGVWKESTRDLAERQAKARSRRSSPRSAVSEREPPARKVFHLFTGDQDFQNEKSYVAVTGELSGVGKHCQVYVDRATPERDQLAPTIADAIRTFDEDVFPRMSEWGRAADVDRDGRFTLFFSPWLGKLQNGRVAVSGFVRGSDFLPEYRPPFGNQCDVLYLNSDLKPGPYLRTILVHEFTHAVIFSERFFCHYLPNKERQDEESWLNEALAHLAEVRHGHAWSNLDYRLAAFLNEPERHGLVIPDYYGRGLWRSPGPRGAAYLFLHRCRERFGDDLPVRLVQSSLHGIANLEAATQEPFADLFRDWCVWLASDQTALPYNKPAGCRYLLNGPRRHDLALVGGRHAVALAGTSAAYLRLHSPVASHAALTITAPPEAQLQVTLVRLPRQPHLEVIGRADRFAKTIQLSATARHGALKLEEVALEKCVPLGETSELAHSSSLSPTWFADHQLPVDQINRSRHLPFNQDGEPWLIKFRARDSKGNLVTSSLIR